MKPFSAIRPKGFFALMLVTAFAFSAMASGTVVTDSINSASLGGAKRYVGVYLPSGYSANPDSTYPSVYYLHGAGGTVAPTNSFVLSYKPLLDTLMALGKIPKMIIIAVDGSTHNKYGNSWYANSILNGNVENYIVQDVVSFVGSKYRAKNDRRYRGIMGHSMGGHGALKLGMKHSDIFGGLSSHSGLTAFDKFLADLSHDLKTSTTAGDSIVGWGQGLHFSMMPAFSPNLSKTDSVDQILDLSNNVVPGVRTTWLAHDPYTLLDTYHSQIKTMFVYVDCGNVDELNFDAHARLIDAKMTTLGIAHTFRMYAGDHCVPLDRGMNLAYLDSNVVTYGLKALGGYFTSVSPGIPNGPAPVTIARMLRQVPGQGISFRAGKDLTGPLSVELFDLSGRAIWKQESKGIAAGQIVRVGKQPASGMYYLIITEQGRILESRKVAQFGFSKPK